MLCVSAALAGLLLLGRRRTRAAGCLLLTFLLGAALGIRTANPTLPPEGDAQVTGVVAGEVDFRAEKGQVRVILRDVTLNGERIASGAYWTFYLKTDENIPDFLTPGARISMTAEVYHPQGQRNPHGYDFRQALRQKNILIGLYGAAKLQALPDGLSLYGLAARFNHRMAQTLRDVCGEKAGQLASAVLLGMRDEVPDEEREQFRRLGIAHILSVSGFHVGVLVALLALLMMPVKHRRLRMALTLPMLLAYAFLTGGNAPAVRAVLLWALVCWGRIRHKRVLMLHVLCASAMIQLLFAPAQLFSASFQMTYGVMAAICGITAQTAPNAQKKRGWKGKILSLLSVSAAAQFGVLLPELYWFGRVPLLGIAVNVLLVTGMNVLLLLDWVTLLLNADSVAGGASGGGDARSQRGISASGERAGAVRADAVDTSAGCVGGTRLAAGVCGAAAVREEPEPLAEPQKAAADACGRGSADGDDFAARAVFRDGIYSA